MVYQFHTIQHILSQAKLHPVYLSEITSPPKDVLDNATNVPNTPSEVEVEQNYINKVSDQTVGGDKVHDNDLNTVLA